MSEMCLSPPGAAGASDPSLLSVSLGAAVFSPVLPCVHRPRCVQTPHSCLSVSLAAAVFSPILPCVHRPLCVQTPHSCLSAWELLSLVPSSPVSTVPSVFRPLTPVCLSAWELLSLVPSSP